MEIKEREIRFRRRVPVDWELTLGQQLDVNVEDPLTGKSFKMNGFVESEEYKDNQDGGVRVVSVVGLIRKE